MAGMCQQWIKRRATPEIPTDRQRAQGIAVVTLTTRDEHLAIVLTEFKKILPCEFECRFHGL